MERQSADNLPVLIGGGQAVQRDCDPAESSGPLELMAKAAREAAGDSGVGEAVFEGIDTVAVVHVLSCDYHDPVSPLAHELGIHPRSAIYSYIGGDTPQALVNALARRIAAGEVGAALLVGAEALNSLRKGHRQGSQVPWVGDRNDGDAKPERFGDSRLGSNDLEMRHGLQLPIHIYPLFENALRAHYGRDIAEHQRALGWLCENLAAQAAGNPFSWFKEPRTSEEIASASEANRYVGFPYTKLMNAMMTVDQGAAVIMTSAARARAMGVDESRLVYVAGAESAYDHWWVSERADYHSSPAARTIFEHVLESAGVSVEQLSFLDLYSCFPSAVQILRDSLGIDAGDDRPLTVTGGLAYHGGAGNNYSMHAIATMISKLRDNPGSYGLVSAMGWYLTKHAVGLYSSEQARPVFTEGRAIQESLDSLARPVVIEEPRGNCVVETYTVMHDREGAPEKGIVIGRLQSGERFVANTVDDRALLEELETRDPIGREAVVTTHNGAGLVSFD